MRRITYELQDLADIFPTHWEPGTAARHWTTPRVSVLFETPLAAGIAGSAEVPVGLQTFLSESLDDEDEDEDRRGYPRKHWFWGAYTMGDSSGFSAAYNDGAPAGTRAVANGDPASLGAYFRQHDYFVHEGSARHLSREPRGWLRRRVASGCRRWIRRAVGSVVRLDDQPRPIAARERRVLSSSGWVTVGVNSLSANRRDLGGATHDSGGESDRQQLRLEALDHGW